MNKQNKPAPEQEVTDASGAPDTTMENNPETAESTAKAAAAPESGSNDNLIAELESQRIDLAEQKDKFHRLYAEFDHFRRRTAKEKLETIKNATEDLVIALLPVLDDMERAQKNLATSSDVEAIKEGLNLVFRKLHKTLEAKGLKAMETLGTPFNADFQEAITAIPVADESQKGLVVDEVEKGYLLNDKTIRFAKVVTGA
ncbi:MAG: nucleotide exchange factor GrpE [Bacteroidota bacterium]